MDRAIYSATSVSSDTLRSYSHVAVIEVVDDSVFVIEAVPLKGVVRRPYEEFRNENPDCDVRRVRPEIIAEIAGRQGVTPELVRWSFVERAKSRIGEGYDYVYGPDNRFCYCSELVYDSFIDTAAMPGDCHLFAAAPMNFLDADGGLPEFWAGLFEAFHVPVPQGVPGTNPNDMFRSPVLIDAEL